MSSTLADGDSSLSVTSTNSEVNRCHPIFDLPSELLAEIFLHTDSTASATDLKDARDYSCLGGGPVAASQVCSLWRQVALAYPNLWSRIRVIVVPGEDASSPIIQAIDVRITRAGEHPLSIEYVETGRIGPRSPLVRLMEYSHRWEFISLTLTHTPLSYLASLYGALPRLRTVSITANLVCAFWMGERPEVQRVFSDAPLLSSFAYRVPGSGAVELPFVLPWEQLLYYSGPLFTVANPPRYARALLKHAQVLAATDVTSFTSWARTELPALRALSAYVQTFAGLVAPSLTDLRVRGSLIGTDVGRLLTFLDRSECRLRKLAMYAVLLGPQADTLVDACGEVEELVCAAGRESNAWVGRLSRLRELTLIIVTHPAAGAGEVPGLSYLVESGALAEIVRARDEKQPQLSKIDLWLNEDCQDALRSEAASELKRAGNESGVEISFHLYKGERSALMDRWMDVY